MIYFHFYLTLLHFIVKLEILGNSCFLVLFLLFAWELFMATFCALPLRQTFCPLTQFLVSFVLVSLYIRHEPLSYLLSITFIKCFLRKIGPFHFLQPRSHVLCLRHKMSTVWLLKCMSYLWQNASYDQSDFCSHMCIVDEQNSIFQNTASASLDNCVDTCFMSM